jgi:Xaa-Pro aminopeptidase
MNLYGGTAESRERASARLPQQAPFDTKRLDELLDEAGIDVLIASSKHNIQYLLGGYRFFFFDYTDALGLSRYLPLFVYRKGRPQEAFYVGNSMESWEDDLGRFWVPVEASSWGSADAMQKAVDRLQGRRGRPLRIGVERAFLPADAEGILREQMPQAKIVDALVPLERLRAVKRPDELELIRVASERVVDAMLAVFSSHGPGTTKRELAEALRREEVSRGLVFEYCLLACGTSRNRAPSDQPWQEGEVLSLDSGGNFGGYIGDLARMGILGEPDSELQDLLAHIDEIQQAARRPIRRGAIGREIYAAADAIRGGSAHRNYLNFVAHGMGLISHEAPRLSSRAPVPYPGDDADKPLQAGMVISIETTMHHPQRGFIKLEDTVAVTETGWEAYGDFGRGWNPGKLPG